MGLHNVLAVPGRRGLAGGLATDQYRCWAFAIFQIFYGFAYEIARQPD